MSLTAAASEPAVGRGGKDVAFAVCIVLRDGLRKCILGFHQLAGSIVGEAQFMPHALHDRLRLRQLLQNGNSLRGVIALQSIVGLCQIVIGSGRFGDLS